MVVSPCILGPADTFAEGTAAAHNPPAQNKKKKKTERKEENCLMEKEVGVGVGGTLERE